MFVEEEIVLFPSMKKSSMKKNSMKKNHEKTNEEKQLKETPCDAQVDFIFLMQLKPLNTHQSSDNG